METFRERTKDLDKQDAVKKRNETPDESASGGASRPADITHENENGGEDKKKMKQKTDLVLPKDEGITLYPTSSLELFGQKRVEKLFQG